MSRVNQRKWFEQKHNPSLPGVTECQTNLLHCRTVWGKLRELFLTPERMRLYIRQHRAILAALRERDAKSARGLMIEHLQAIQENVFA